MTQEQIARSVEIARKYGATRVLLFGSAAESPETARDLDLAVGGVPGWDFFRMAAEIEEALRIPLDVVPLEPANPFVLHISERGRVIYECG